MEGNERMEERISMVDGRLVTMETRMDRLTERLVGYDHLQEEFQTINQRFDELFNHLQPQEQQPPPIRPVEPVQPQVEPGVPHLVLGRDRELPRNQPEARMEEEYNLLSRLPRVDLPKFEGDNFQDWLYQIEQFFEVDMTPEHAKVRLAAINMEGRALQWHRAYIAAIPGGVVLWRHYVADLTLRFGRADGGDPLSKLAKLKQWSTVQQNQEQFEILLNQVTLQEAHAISLFLSGLNEEIENAVRCFEPRSLIQTMNLAKFHESTFNALHRKNKTQFKTQNTLPPSKLPPLLPTPKQFPLGFSSNSPYPSRTNPTNVTRSNATLKPIKNLSQKEWEQKRLQGLCYRCDEKYTPGHKCKKAQLFQVLIDFDSDGEKGRTGEEDLISFEEEEGECKRAQEDKGKRAMTDPVISLNAICGAETFKTLKLLGTIRKQAVVMLLDTGSTHNFIDSLLGG
ncbi:Retrotransposon gag protein [Quillaja saponaria]|uniref:Retrotransposon gag protein n=1 Tax=Quillaja saponaria TaxID=32244 RepID=A0AAD7QCL0_QUISA|nr:Retrotransposon gag protein [Quillaja saponaria]